MDLTFDGSQHIQAARSPLLMILCGLNVTVLCPCLHQLPDLQVLQQKGEDLDTKQGLMLSTTLSSNGMMPLPRKRDWIHV